MKIKIRKANLHDVGAIAYSWTGLLDYHEGIDLSYYKRSKNAMANYKRFVRKCIRVHNKRFYVAEADGKIVGHIGLEIKYRPPIFDLVRYGYVIESFVQERFRKKGILKSLLKEAEKWFKKKNIKFMELRVAFQNKEGTKIWKHCGFSTQVKMMHKKLQ